MPIARIDVPDTIGDDRVAALADAVHDAMVATVDVPPADRFQIISRHAPEQLRIDPTYPGMMRSADAVIVSITFRRGRTDEQKRALYRTIVTEAQRRGGFRPDDILIALTENTLSDWSFGRGEPAVLPSTAARA